LSFSPNFSENFEMRSSLARDALIVLLVVDGLNFSSGLNKLSPFQLFEFSLGLCLYKAQ